MDTSKSLRLRYHPDPSLRVKCTECEWPIEERRRIGKEMIDIMFDHNGMGLAAPQVGLNQRLFVMRDPHEPARRSHGMIFSNPEIVEHGHDKPNDFEGCLSLLSVKTKIKRWHWVEFGFDDLEEPGERLVWRFEGVNARCVQHEIDHLDGILIFDHINSNLVQKLFLERYAKARKAAGRRGEL